MKRKFYLLALFCTVVGASVVSSCKDTEDDLYTFTKTQLGKDKAKWDELDAKVNALQAKVDGLQPGQPGQPGQSCTCDPAILATLQTAVDALKAQKLDADAVQALIDEVVASIAKFDITGVSIQAVYNPAFGSLVTPFGINTKVLMGYYGSASANFPANDGADGNLTPAELATLSVAPAAQDLSGKDAVLGAVALTVNPANISYAGKTPVLRTVTKEVPGVTFSALAECGDDLMFGYTRGITGAYVTEATVADPDQVKLHMNLKDKAKEIRDAVKGTGINVASLANVMYQTISKVTPCYALQLTSDNENTVISDYDLAAVLVNPMGFETVKTIADSKYAGKAKDYLKKTSITIPYTISSSVTVDGTEYPLSSSASATVNLPSIVKTLLDKVGAVIDDVPALTMPALIAKNGNKVQVLSLSASAPTEVGSSVDLHATSFCAETLVPFAKKFVAVTKVTGASADAQALANQNMAEVVDGGSDYVISLSHLASGATYEIAYSALDYNGKTETNRFYIKVK